MARDKQGGGLPHLRTTFWDLRSMHQDPLQAFIVFVEIKGGQNSSHHFPDLLGLGGVKSFPYKQICGLCFEFWPFTTMKLCPIAHIILPK